MRVPHRLTQAEIDNGDFGAAIEATQRDGHVDASKLVFPEPRLRELLDALPAGPAGGPPIRRWSFVGAAFIGPVSFEGADVWGTRFDGASFDAGVSFEGARFSHGRFDRVTFGVDANFTGADFRTKAHFGSAIFGDRARFARARFAATQFHDCTFGARATFRQARFSAPARFGHCYFGDNANFTNAEFERGAEFAGTSFGTKAQMVRTIFRGDASFAGASFGARARLTRWTVGGRLNMRSIRFNGPMSLHGARVGSDAVFKYARFGDTVDLGAVRVARNCSFTGAAFLGADRIGPIQVQGALLFAQASFHTACSLETDARVLALPGARVLAPARVAVQRGVVVLNGLQSSSRLVLSAVSTSPHGRPRLIGAENADVGSLVVSGLDVRALRLRGADNIDTLRLEAGAGFEPVPRGLRAVREAVAEEHLLRKESADSGGWYPAPCHPGIRYPASPPDHDELARIYRGLRKAREDAKDAPGAGDLYYAEMEMRRTRSANAMRSATRAATWLSRLVETTILVTYKYGGGYGVRPSRPLLALLVTMLAAALMADCLDALAFVPPEDQQPGAAPVTEPACLGQALVFVMRSALLLPTSSTIIPTLGGEVLQIIFRLLGPLLIGLLAFGLRARVQR